MGIVLEAVYEKNTDNQTDYKVNETNTPIHTHTNRVTKDTYFSLN